MYNLAGYFSCNSKYFKLMCWFASFKWTRRILYYIT